MKESIFNLFYFVEGASISELGVVVHNIEGSDSEKESFLRQAVATDYKASQRHSPPYELCTTAKGANFTLGCFTALVRQGRVLLVFEEIFKKYNAPDDPICCVTAIVDGKPEIDLVADHAPLFLSRYQGHEKIGFGVMSDYLEDYLTPQGFDLPALLNHDYFEAIRLVYNNSHYVSCMKLLVSFIDTMAFLEFGDTAGNFKSWLDKYAELKKVNITSSQLWELRNSILHMSNLDSRKVLQGQEKRISFCVAQNGFVPDPDLETQYFNLSSFIEVVTQGLSRWIESYNDERSKFPAFIERYDRIISDRRYAISHTKRSAKV